MGLLVVTGYVRIDNPRSSEEYQRLGADLQRITAAPIHVFQHGLEECWFDRPAKVALTHAIGDNPRKNTLDYHVVMHQKTAWLATASELKPDATVLVWLDYGILHQPGVTVDVIDEFLRRVDPAESEICIPGAWPKEARSPMSPDWRFCGSSMIMPRIHARAFHAAVRSVTKQRLAIDKLVTWEINDWAVVEQWSPLPIRWYPGDHNQTQFTNYEAHHVAR